jgi:RNA polymerase sigma-70 factor (ECF subfamily)
MASAHPEFSLLLRASADENQAAVADLLERFVPQLRQRLQQDFPRRFQSVLSPDDVLQQTFVDAYRDIVTFAGRDEAAFERWLWAIARRNLVDATRALEAEKRGGGRLRVEDKLGGDGSEALLELLLTVSGPSRAISREEAASAVQKALEALPAEYRRCVEAVDLQGRPIETVAAELGRSKGACYMMRSRALRLLREYLGRTSKFI